MPAQLKVLFTATLLTTAVVVAQQPSENVGEVLFFGKAGCASCHAVNGRGGVAGPDLSAAGTQSLEQLREKILNPKGLTVIVKTADGREIQGV